MPRDLSIRRFDPADADGVWDVHEAALRASALAFVEEAAIDDDILGVESHYIEADGEFLVGEVAGDASDRDGPEIVAIGGYLPIDEERVEIKRMRVDPEYQRQGFASAILEELETRASEACYGVAELETVEPLQAAQAFYEAAGYEVVETSVDEMTGITRYRYRTEL